MVDDTIVLTSGLSYGLTIPDTLDDSTNAAGDLDLFNFEGVVVTTDGAARATIDANGDGAGDPAATNDRALTLGPGATGAGDVTLDNLVITDGSTGTVSGSGGAIWSLQAFSLTITRSRITANRTTEAAGAMRLSGPPTTISDSTIDGNTAGSMGGIFLEATGATLDVSGSTISGNSATGTTVGSPGFAGGLFAGSPSTTNLKNTTISGNTANSDGGGVYAAGTVTLANATIAGNTADADSGGPFAGNGGGVYVTGTLTTRNSIIADNFDNFTPFHNDCSGAITSQKYNLIGSGVGCTGIDPIDDLQGLSNVTGSLADNGGPTQTRRIAPGSPADNAGNPANPTSGPPACETTDQRGLPRDITVSTCDIGAYEQQPPVLDPVGNKAVQAGQNLGFTATATDPDPGDTLTFSGTNLPTGASMSMAGLFSWTPTTAQVGSFPNVQINVADGSLGDNEMITITVTPVPPPVLTGTDPSSPANNNNPKVFGTAQAGSTVTVYPNGTCTPPHAFAGPESLFASPGFTITVPDNSTTTFSATATSGAATSSCSTMNVTYTEVTPPPPPSGGGSTPAGSTPTPQATGQRAAALKKCKKKKSATARRNCKKRANKLPL